MTPTGPHTLKISSSLLKSQQVQSIRKKVESNANSNRPSVMQASVSVQTPIFVDDTDNSASGANAIDPLPDKSNLMKARECCLDVATTALERSEELGRITNSRLEAVLPNGNEHWDLNSSEDLISIIATGDLFSDGTFGRNNSSESTSATIASGQLKSNQYQLPANTSGGARGIPTLTLTEVESEEENETFLDERTGEFKIIHTISESEDEEDTPTSRTVEMILDKATGEFIPSDSMNLSSDFDSKCQVNSASGGHATLPNHRSRGQEVNKSGSIQKTVKKRSMSCPTAHDVKDRKAEFTQKKVIFNPVVKTNGPQMERERRKQSHVKKPIPAHSASGRSKRLYEQDDRQAVDMRKSVLGLQVDGIDDSRESHGNSSKGKGDESSSEESSQSSIQAQNTPSESYHDVNQQTDQTLSEYSELYGQNSTQKTPTEPSSQSSGMAVSSESSVTTVEGEHNDYTEYQPEVYYFQSSSSVASSGSEVVVPVDNLAQSQEPQQAPMIVLPQDLEKECRDTISSCDQLLRSFEGSHLDMSTVSAVTTGSMNTTTDIGNNEAPRQTEVISGLATSSTVTLEVADDNYEAFRSGIKTCSSPQHSSLSDVPTELCPDVRNTTDNQESARREVDGDTERSKTEMDLPTDYQRTREVNV